MSEDCHNSDQRIIQFEAALARLKLCGPGDLLANQTGPYEPADSPLIQEMVNILLTNLGDQIDG